MYQKATPHAFGRGLRSERQVREQNEKSDRIFSQVKGEGPDYPMYYVSHDEAMEFCRRWSESERRAGRLPSGWTYELPTEAQWEYACRAGTTTATAFGDRLSSHEANCAGSAPYNGAAKGPDLEKTTPVGSYSRNRWGLFDMHGNVFEWCFDRYDKQLSGGVDPRGPSTGSKRVIRGGAFDLAAAGSRAAMREGLEPTRRDGAGGFRLARVRSGQQ
jgi:formylglycine-generating enzyme